MESFNRGPVPINTILASYYSFNDNALTNKQTNPVLVAKLDITR